MDIDAIQQGLADAVSAMGQIQTYPSVPGSINPPAFCPVEFDLDYNQTFTNSMAELLFSCGIYITDSAEARSTLTDYLSRDGARSLKTYIEADRTLGGEAKTLNVERARGAYRLYEIGGIHYLGAVLDVRVWA